MLFIVIIIIEPPKGSTEHVHESTIALLTEQGLRSTFRPSVFPIVRPQPRRAAGLLLSVVQAGDIDRQRRRPGAV